MAILEMAKSWVGRRTFRSKPAKPPPPAFPLTGQNTISPGEIIPGQASGLSETTLISETCWNDSKWPVRNCLPCLACYSHGNHNTSSSLGFLCSFRLFTNLELPHVALHSIACPSLGRVSNKFFFQWH